MARVLENSVMRFAQYTKGDGGWPSDHRGLGLNSAHAACLQANGKKVHTHGVWHYWRVHNKRWPRAEAIDPLSSNGVIKPEHTMHAKHVNGIGPQPSNSPSDMGRLETGTLNGWMAVSHGARTPSRWRPRHEDGVSGECSPPTASVRRWAPPRQTCTKRRVQMVVIENRRLYSLDMVAKCVRRQQMCKTVFSTNSNGRTMSERLFTATLVQRWCRVKRKWTSGENVCAVSRGGVGAARPSSVVGRWWFGWGRPTEQWEHTVFWIIVCDVTCSRLPKRFGIDFRMSLVFQTSG